LEEHVLGEMRQPRLGTVEPSASPHRQGDGGELPRVKAMNHTQAMMAKTSRVSRAQSALHAQVPREKAINMKNSR
jgi:hypothetical protein